MNSKKLKLSAILLFGLGLTGIQAQNAPEFPVLKGPYLGQKPPGKTPEIFAPGIISTGLNEMNICFSPAGDEMYYYATTPAFRPRIILSSRMKDSVWTIPMELPFFTKARVDYYPFLSPDGKKLFFNSTRPYEGMDSANGFPFSEIWFVERNNNTWSNPQKIDFGGKYKGKGSFPSVALSGNIYFSTRFDREVIDIYCSKYENGIYSTPERLSDSVNSKSGTFHPYIASDESYLLFESTREESGFGGSDIYISFRKKNGEWSKAKNIGSTINSPDNEMRPYVTFDGKYLFFISNKASLPALPEKQMTIYNVNDSSNRPGNGSQDVYWVSADFIRELKKQFLKK